MASAQVMSSSSRKQEHLEAGKRRLEEFRKKKAAARKAVSASQSHPVPTENEKQTSDNGQAQLVNSVGAVSDGPVADSCSEINNLTSSHSLQKQPEQEGITHNISSLKSETGLNYSDQTINKVGMLRADTGNENYADGISFVAPSVSKDNNSNYFYSFLNGVETYDSNKNIRTSAGPPHTAMRLYAEGHATNLLHNDESDSANLTMDACILDSGRNEHVGSESNNLVTSGLEDIKPGNPELLSADFNSDARGSFNVPSYSSYPESYPRRSRPSFLDSLNISREPVVSVQPHSEKEKFMPSSFTSSNFVASSANLDHSTKSAPGEPLPSVTAPVPSADFVANTWSAQKLIDDSLDSKRDSDYQKQNEDFAALEQHIEDLTQEKFSLQRSLDASKALAESLASENSSLTESYNQQASIVNQLKDEMEKLQGEIKARLVELESFKAEYMNAQLECNAADERAKLLASEVIGLEEKALRLRSNELKLERELENSSAEIASYKKKFSSLEKERQDLLQTIDALQEEKKLVQSMYQKASGGAVSGDVDRGCAKKDVSTSTDDLGLDSAGTDGDDTEQVLSNALVHQDGDLLTLAQHRSAGFQDSAMSVPPDQMQTIQSIDSLISELMAEKEDLIQALVTEVSTSTKLKDMNEDLSQKLEVQTQRLELLTAQSMAHQIIPAKGSSSSLVQESVAYADEGDEVVERVLGWIMKLFPGGPSKRRTSRL